MSTPRVDELAQLHYIADELREVFGERGHKVDRAMGTDPAFCGGRCRSALQRGLVEEAVGVASSQIGMQSSAVRGGGLELRYLAGFHDRRYRVRKARRLSNGSLEVVTSSDGSLVPPDEEPTLIDIKPWVFAVLVGDDGQIGEVVAAEVLGVDEGTPGRLVLGQEIPLGRSSDPSPDGFRSSEEGLEGFDEDDEDDEDYGSAAS